MWKAIAKYAVKVAIWAASHPDEVKAIVDQVKDAAGEIKDAPKHK